MKKRFFYLLLLPMMAFTMSSCFKDKAWVTPSSVHFGSEYSSQTVWFYGSYNYYTAEVDADGQGWCTVDDLGEGLVDIIATENTGAARSCCVNFYVDYGSSIVKSISVTQDAGNGGGGGGGGGSNGIEVTEPTFVRFNFETEAHRHHTDYGGSFDAYEMLYLWHREWNEMTVDCSQSGDRLTFWAHDDAKAAPNGDLLFNHEWEVEILVTGFVEPYNRCVVSQVTYRHHKIGRNPDPDAFWQSSETNEIVTLTNIPLKDHNISVNGKTGRLYFEYTDEDLQVSQCKVTSRSEALNNAECYTEDYEYVGSDRDIGLVELKFNLK